MPGVEKILTDQHDGVQTITLNQPDRLNALTMAMYGDLASALRTAERDPGVRAVVLTGAGAGFSSGADITEFEVSNGTPLDLGEALRKHINPVILRIRALEKPVLAAVNGVAAGAGLGLALACDVRYAAQSARLVVAFVRIGLVPDAGCLYFLPRLIGPAKTLELSWTGDAVSAEEAYNLGMVNRVLPDDQVLAKTQELATRLARGPAKTIGLIKRGLNQAHELPLERVLDLEASYQTAVSRESDFAEGVSAFREKRAARFR
jgi:2-(1,2-epoxy-1,2-dihydrophenyl)acetyl-CoA isomerase